LGRCGTCCASWRDRFWILLRSSETWEVPSPSDGCRTRAVTLNVGSDAHISIFILISPRRPFDQFNLSHINRSPTLSSSLLPSLLHFTRRLLARHSLVLEPHHALQCILLARLGGSNRMPPTRRQIKQRPSHPRCYFRRSHQESSAGQAPCCWTSLGSLRRTRSTEMARTREQRLQP
jgi:hypothetical protein